MAFKLNMGNKPTDPNNFSQRDQKTMNASRATFDRNGQMAQIPGSDNPANYRKQSSGLLGFIGGAAGKAAMKVVSKLKDKPAYGIDQYKYAATKGKDALKRIKDGLK
jgi:hypothetical protein